MKASERARRQISRWWFGLSLGLGAVGACAGAMPEGGAADPRMGAEPVSKGSAPDAGLLDAAADGECKYGRLEDPHRGFVRCLEPDEADASWLPPAPQPEPPGADAGAPGQDAGLPSGDAGAPSVPTPGDAGAAGALTPSDAGPAVAAPAPGPPPLVEVKPASFTNGDVPNVDKKLQKLSDGIAQCVAGSGGLSGASGIIKLQFLVRARGRAEGVEVLSAKGVSAGARECMRLLLKDKPVGAPTADPVGVTVTISLKAAR